MSQVDSSLPGIARVDKALATLLDNLTSCNPQILRAHETRNNALGEPLRRQKLEAKETARREQTESDRAQLKAKLDSLAELRAEIFAAPYTPSLRQAREDTASRTRQVPINELIEFAKAIAPFSPPEGYKAPKTESQPDNVQSSGSEARTQSTGETVVDLLANGTEALLPDVDTQTEGRTKLDFLSDQERAWLDPLTQVAYLPWASEETIRASALARLQNIPDFGSSVASVNNTGLQGQALDVGRQNETLVNNGQIPQRQQALALEKPKVFGGLDLYDSEDEDN